MGASVEPRLTHTYLTSTVPASDLGREEFP